jgi:hypothetical protein
MKNNNNLLAIADTAMPAVFQNMELTYNAAKNVFLTHGYTSLAGNTYYQGIRFSDRIIITQQIGEGYFYTFLNGIRIFGFNGKEATLIAEKSYYCCVYNENFLKSESENLIREYLKSQAELMGGTINSDQLNDFTKELVESTMTNKVPYNKQLNN